MKWNILLNVHNLQLQQVLGRPLIESINTSTPSDLKSKKICFRYLFNRIFAI